MIFKLFKINTYNYLLDLIPIVHLQVVFPKDITAIVLYFDMKISFVKG